MASPKMVLATMRNLRQRWEVLASGGTATSCGAATARRRHAASSLRLSKTALFRVTATEINASSISSTRISDHHRRASSEGWPVADVAPPPAVDGVRSASASPSGRRRGPSMAGASSRSSLAIAARHHRIGGAAIATSRKSASSAVLAKPCFDAVAAPANAAF